MDPNATLKRNRFYLGKEGVEGLELRERWMPGKHMHREPRRLRLESPGTLGAEEERRHGRTDQGVCGRVWWQAD